MLKYPIFLKENMKKILSLMIGIFLFCSIISIFLFFYKKNAYAITTGDQYSLIVIDNQKQEIVLQKGNVKADYRPSSTFKCVTAAALLENGIDVNEKLDTSQYIIGEIRIPSSALESNLREELDITECVIRNLISVWGREADKLSSFAYGKTMQQFGFSVNIDNSQQTLTKIAIGQDVEISLQEMADFYTAAYNEGLCWRTQKSLMQKETALQVKKWIENSNENQENRKRAEAVGADICGYWGSVISEDGTQMNHSFIGTLKKDGTEYGFIINKNTPIREDSTKKELLECMKKIIDEI